ncbi:MAG: hypothetical protein K6B70_04495 [Clostridia bacterium]|nr:hypothetical protein [Clostridia bacterium]
MKKKCKLSKLIFFKDHLEYLKENAIKSLKDDNLKIDLLKDEDFCNTNLKHAHQKLNIIKSLGEDAREELLKSKELIQKIGLYGFQIEQIITELGDEKKKQILSDKNVTEGLGLKDFNVVNLISEIKDDKIKLYFIDTNNYPAYLKERILGTLTYKEKSRILAENIYDDLTRYNIINIISSMSADECMDFFKNNEQYTKEKNVKVFDIVRRKTDLEKQLEFVYNIDKFNLSENEERLIIAGLKNKTKEKLDFTKIDEKYKELAMLKLEEGISSCYDRIIPNIYLTDLSIYKDLDEILSIMPQDKVKTNDDREQFKKLCNICPNMDISDRIGIGASTVSEYLEGEKWIDNVLSNLKEDWTEIEKMAYIHTAIGKRVSYTPEQGTEVEKPDEERPLWKIITNKEGVCNGIAQLEQYMFLKIGIESEVVNAQIHSYLRAKNVEIPTNEGIKKGDTLLDPTWDLANSRFNARLHHFCRSYDEIRKYDINTKNVDRECHKNDDLEKADLIELDEQNLRKICTSIGVADKDGVFLSSDMLEKTNKIDELCLLPDTNISSKFNLLKEKCPEFAECINSSIKIMQCILFQNNQTLNYKKCVVSKVFDKSDEEKNAVLFAYFDLGDKGKRFYYADKEKADFIRLSQENFEKRFDCYESDLEDGKRLWEQEEQKEEDLEKSSGKIVEGDER